MTAVPCAALMVIPELVPPLTVPMLNEPLAGILTFTFGENAKSTSLAKTVLSAGMVIAVVPVLAKV